MNRDEKNALWAVAEHSDGKIRPVTYEIISFAKDAAEVLGKKVKVAAPGYNIQSIAEEIASTTGCDALAINMAGARQAAPLQSYNAEVYRYLLKEAFNSDKPYLVFIPHTATGWDFAPALAVDMKASCITAVNGFKYDDGPVFTRQICNGKIYEEVRPLPDRPAIITVMPGTAQPLDNAKEAGGVRVLEIGVPPARSKTLKYLDAPPQSLNLQEAEVIVAAGRGLGGSEHLDMIHELASLFGRGAVGASRPVVDNGWLEHEAQVGQTGQTVSPKLYIACGISGAIQHTMGMKNSDLIIAINRDKGALFCKVADYCVAENLHEFIPALIEKIRSFKRGQ